MGAITVAELDWADPRHLAGVKGPFDYILAADCIYHENLVRDLYRVILELTTERSTGRSNRVWIVIIIVFVCGCAQQDLQFEASNANLQTLKQFRGANIRFSALCPVDYGEGMQVSVLGRGGWHCFAPMLGKLVCT